MTCSSSRDGGGGGVVEVLVEVVVVDLVGREGRVGRDLGALLVVDFFGLGE